MESSDKKNVTSIGISVIMPALNEEDNVSNAISNVLLGFEHFFIDGEIIVINDGSTDKTKSIVEGRAFRDKRIIVINHEKPKGIGASFWDGVEKASKSAVVMLPGDNENDADEIFRYYGLLEHVDIVIPFLFNKYARSWFRNLLSYLYRSIINTTFFVNFNYTNGTVLYRKAILTELDYHSYGFFFQTDILIRTVKRGYLFAEVPYRLGVRKEGGSKALTFPSFLSVVKGYLWLFRDYYRKGHSYPEFSRESITFGRCPKNNGDIKS